jgi:NADPH2:quinone reductase
MAPRPETISVCEVTEFGDPEVLCPAERAWPVPHDDELVVQITVACVNPTDLSARSGAHRSRMPDLQTPFVPGWDLAGVVAEAPAGSAQYSPGDAVVGMIPWIRIGGRTGSYAQAAAVKPEWLAPLPEGIDEVIAATIPLNALTARQSLDLLDLERGQTLLITGASGAVGSFATQLAAQDGIRVLALCSEGDEEWVASLGAAEVLPRSTDFETIEEVDALLDAVPLGPKATAPVKLGGVGLFTRRVEVPGRPDLRVETPLVSSDARALAALTEQVAAGKLRTRVAQILPLANAAEAHRLVQRGGLRGKVVLRTRD